MPQYAGIIKIGLGTFIRMQVGAANADLLYAQHYIPFFNKGLASLLVFQFSGFYAN